MDIKAKQLLDILYDTTARIDEKDDAAMDLSAYPTQDVLEELVLFASNPAEEYIILASLGESIGEIMIANDKFQTNLIEKLTLTAKDEALARIGGKKPEWLNK